MSTHVQTVVNALVVAASLVGAILVPVVLMGSVQRKGTWDPRTRIVPVVMAVGLAVWYAVVSAVGSAGGFRGDGSASAHIPMVGFGVFVPLAVGLIALQLVAPLRRLVADDEIQPSLIAIQSYRVVAGGVFLYLLGVNQLPAVFALPAGVGDVLVGLTAFAAATSVRDRRQGRAITWNLLGLLDLVVAIGIGVTTSPGPVHLIHATPTTLAMSASPLVVVPTFLVPLSFWLHVVSLRFLLGGRGGVGTAG